MVTIERVTVSLPAELLAGIDRLENNRSRFITEAVSRELERRRREALLLSLQAPHPDTDGLVDLGTGDWLAGVNAEDEGLLDPDAGTPIAWEPGTGWKEGGR